LRATYDKDTARSIACDAHVASKNWRNVVYDALVNQTLTMGRDRGSVATAEGLITAMELTGRAQAIQMAFFDVDVDLLPPDIDFDAGGHAVLVYKWEDPHFYVYDNNDNGDSTLRIKYNRDGFDPGIEPYKGYNWFYHEGEYARRPLPRDIACL